MAMPNDVYDRVWEEHEELKLKLTKLQAFVENETNAAKVDREQWLLMHDQYHYMKGYARILQARLNAR